MAVHIYEESLAKTKISLEAVTKLLRGIRQTAKIAYLSDKLSVAVRINSDEPVRLDFMSETGSPSDSENAHTKRLRRFERMTEGLGLTLVPGPKYWEFYSPDSPGAPVARVLPGFDRGDGSFRWIKAGQDVEFPLLKVKPTALEREAIHAKFGGSCAFCGEELGEHWGLSEQSFAKQEHFISVDYFPSCSACIRSRGRKTLEGWRSDLAKLTEKLNTHPYFVTAKSFGLIQATNNPVAFYFERVNANLLSE